MRKLHMSQETSPAPRLSFLALCASEFQILNFHSVWRIMKHVAGKRGTQNCRFSDVPLDEWNSGSPSAWTFNLRPSSLIEFGFEQKFMTEVSDFPSTSSNNWLTLVCLYKAQRRCSQSVFQCHPVIISFWESKELQPSGQKENWLICVFKDYKVPPSFQTHISNVKTNHVSLSAHWMWCTAVAVYSHRLHDSFTNTIINQLTKHNWGDTSSSLLYGLLPYLSPCNGN